MKNEKTLRKIAKGAAIGVGLYVLGETAYTMGKGRMLNILLEGDIDAKEMYKLLENAKDLNLSERMRVNLIKFMAEPIKRES